MGEAPRVGISSCLRGFAVRHDGGHKRDPSSKSPSCGLGSTKTYDETGALLHRHGTGLFAAVLTAQLPDFPVEEEASLADPACLSRFIELVRAYRPGR